MTNALCTGANRTVFMVLSETSDSRIKNGTRTSGFGVSKREGHDSSRYYGSRMYDGIPRESDVGEVQDFPDELRDTFHCADSRDL